MKRLSSLLLLLVLAYATAHAQTDIVIGAGALSGTSSNGATGDPGPMYRSSATSSFVYSRHHYLYTEAELQAAGIPPNTLITHLAWNKDNNAASNSNFLFEIWMKNSSLTAVQTPPQTNATLTASSTQVYSSSATSLSSAIGYVSFALSTPFLYTGGALEITVNFDMSSGSSPWTTAGISWKKDNISNRTISYCGSSANTSLGNARTVRPQLKITYIPATCTGTPDPTSATGITEICSDSSFTLTATGRSLGNGYSYKWQKRQVGSGTWTDVPGAIDSFMTISENTTAIVTYEYRFVTTCSGSGLSSYSNTHTVTVAPPPVVAGITESHTGHTYTFTATGVQHSSNYFWDYGDGTSGTSNVHTYTLGGIYNVMVIVSNECTSDTATQAFTVFIPCNTPEAGLLSALSGRLCRDEEVFLEPTGYTDGFDISYQWQSSPAGMNTFANIPDATSVQYLLTGMTNMEYRLKVTCSATGLVDYTNPINVGVIQRPDVSATADVTIAQFTDATFLATTPGDVKYRWQSSFDGNQFYFLSDNGVFGGVNTAQLTVMRAAHAQSGMQFRCIVTDTTGCDFGSDTSSIGTLTVIDPASVGDVPHAPGITVYPNPVKDGSLHIHSGSQGQVSVQVMDNMGRKLWEQYIELDKNDTMINVSILPAGQYMLRVLNNETGTVQQLPFTKL